MRTFLNLALLVVLSNPAQAIAKDQRAKNAARGLCELAMEMRDEDREKAGLKPLGLADGCVENDQPVSYWNCVIDGLEGYSPFEESEKACRDKRNK